MLITPVDEYCDLYRIENIFPQHIVDAVLATDWLSLPWQRQEGQENWARRRIDNSALPWINEWDQHFKTVVIPGIEQGMGRRLQGYQGTAWWLDEPGFTCSMHTDGEMPGSCQITWIGDDHRLGTAFYHYKDPNSLRYHFPMQPNSGYVMINSLDSQGARHLQWHAMLTPVPENTFRLNSYSWITEAI